MKRPFKIFSLVLLVSLSLIACNGGGGGGNETPGTTAPNITVTDSSAPANDLMVPFGILVQGTTLDHTVTVTNSGTANLSVGAVSGASAPFSMPADACSNQTIAPAGTCTFTVHFAPVSAGTYTGSIAIPSNDPVKNFVAISLSGTANSTTGVNKVFVTSVSGNGNLSSWPTATGTGLAAADAVCQARAIVSGLTGTFKAWLSDGNDDAYCRVHNLTGKRSANCGQGALPATAGPWVRTDGFPFGAKIDQLLSNGKVYAPIRTDESGTTVSGTLYYFTDTTIDGSIHPSYLTPCSNWTSTLNTDSAGGGNTDMTSATWTNQFYFSCSNSTMRLICMQTGPGAALPAFAPTGKKVFLTSAMGNGNLGGWAQAGGKTGLAAGDAICQDLAVASGLTGTFKAWLSDSTTDAISRLTSNGPWIRLDGVKVTDNKADLTDGSLFTSINLTETGVYYGNYGAWSGTTDDGLRTTDTCSNWTDGTGASNGSYGTASNAGIGWSGYASGLACGSGAFMLRCFED